MNFLKSFALIAGLAFVSANISAQTQNDNKAAQEKAAQQMTDNIKKNVSGITVDQQGKILSIENEYAANMQTISTTSNSDTKSIMAKYSSFRASRDAKIQKVLSVDQFAQYRKMIRETEGVN